MNGQVERPTTATPPLTGGFANSSKRNTASISCSLFIGSFGWPSTVEQRKATSSANHFSPRVQGWTEHGMPLLYKALTVGRHATFLHNLIVLPTNYYETNKTDQTACRQLPRICHFIYSRNVFTIVTFTQDNIFIDKNQSKWELDEDDRGKYRKASEMIFARVKEK